MTRIGLVPALAIMIGLAACAPSNEVEQPEADPPFYVITGPDGAIEGWLLGTIHALPDGIEWRTQALDQAIADADYLIVEVAGLDDRQAMASTFNSLATSPGHPDLTERVSPELRGSVRELIRKSDFPAHAFAGIETWAAALMLAQTMGSGDPANGVDRAVIRAFSDREVRELEGALAQLSIFDRLAEEDQRVLLEQVARDYAAEDHDPSRLRKAWLAGDTAVLEQATSEGIMADPQVREALLVRRNVDWAGMIADDLAGPARPLVAVGAAHLVGPDSLPAMLETRGYTVTRFPH